MLKPLLTMLASFVLAAPVHCQDGWASRDFDDAIRQMNDFVDRFWRNLINPISRAVGRELAKVPTAAASAVAGRTAVARRKSPVPRLKTAACHADRRRTAPQPHEQLLVGYTGIERHSGVNCHEVAGAVPALIAGGAMGCRDSAVPDEHLSAFVALMERIIGSDHGFSSADVEARYVKYERPVCLGMLIADARAAPQRRPPTSRAASMWRTAERYLQALLSPDAALVRVTAQSLVIR